MASPPYNTLSRKPTPPFPALSFHRSFGSCCVPLPTPPSHPYQILVPPVPSETSVRTTRTGYLPSYKASHSSPLRKVSVSLTHTPQRRQPARTMSLCRNTSDTGAHTLDGCREQRNAKRMSPSDHHTDLPSRPPYTPPTNSGGGYVARRSAGESPRIGCSGFFSLTASSPRQTRSLGRRRTARSLPSQPPLPGRLALRRTTRNTDVPPPLPPPPLIVLPLPKGPGNPPAQRQPITHLLREPDPTFSRPSAEQAQYAAALAYTGARKAGEPEPA